jgi:hypothetical protein
MAKNEIEEIDPSDLEPIEEIDPSDLEEVEPIKSSKPSAIGQAVIGTAKGIGSGIKSLAESTAQTIPDVAVLGAQGALAGWSDEAIAGLKASTVTPFSEESWSDLYERYKKVEEERIKKARESSPWLGTGAEIVGAAVPAIGMAVLSKGKSIPKSTQDLKSIMKTAGKIGLAEGAIGGLGSSEASLIKAAQGDIGEIEEAIKDTAGGAAVGAIAGPVLSAAGYGAGKALKGVGSKMGEFTEKYAPLRQAKEAFESKFKGVDFESDAGNLQLIREQNKFSDKVASDILSFENILGKELNDTIVNSSKKGVKIATQDLDPLIKTAEEILGTKKNYNKKILQELKSFEITPSQTAELGTNIVERSSDPNSLYRLRDVIKNKLSELDLKTDKEEFAVLNELQNAIKNKLENNVDGFKNANTNFELFRSSVGETIINRGKNLSLSIKDPTTQTEQLQRIRKYASDLPNYKQTLTDIINSDISAAGRFGTSGDSARLTFDSLQKNIKKFEELTGKKIKDYGIDLDADTIASDLKKRSDVSGIRQKIHGYDAGYGESSNLGKGSALLKGIYMAPRYAGTAARVGKEVVKQTSEALPSPSKLLGKLNNLSDDRLYKLADSVGDRFPSQAKALKDSLKEKNSYRRNAVIFSLSQNPEFRNTAPYIMEQITSGLPDEEEENEQ